MESLKSYLTEKSHWYGPDVTTKTGSFNIELYDIHSRVRSMVFDAFGISLEEFVEAIGAAVKINSGTVEVGALYHDDVESFKTDMGCYINFNDQMEIKFGMGKNKIFQLLPSVKKNVTASTYKKLEAAVDEITNGPVVDSNVDLSLNSNKKYKVEVKIASRKEIWTGTVKELFDRMSDTNDRLKYVPNEYSFTDPKIQAAYKKYFLEGPDSLQRAVKRGGLID